MANLLEIEIGFIADEREGYFVVGVAFGLIQPFANVIECLSAGDIVHQDDTDGSSIVRPGDRFECLLSCLKHRDNGTVSQICSLICLPLAWMTLEPNSTPIVVSWSNLNFFSRNCSKMHDFPTPDALVYTYWYRQWRWIWTGKSMSSFLRSFLYSYMII